MPVCCATAGGGGLFDGGEEDGRGGGGGQRSVSEHCCLKAPSSLSLCRALFRRRLLRSSALAICLLFRSAHGCSRMGFQHTSWLHGFCCICADVADADEVHIFLLSLLCNACVSLSHAVQSSLLLCMQGLGPHCWR